MVVMRRALFDQAAQLAAEHLASVREQPVSQPRSVREMRERLAGFDFAEPLDASAVLDCSAALLRDGLTHATHPRYFGLFNPSPLAVSVAAELLVAAFNPQLAVWSRAPMAVEIEQHVLRYLGVRLGFDGARVAGSFTTGGAEANHTGVLLALTRRFPEFAGGGARALAGQPRLYASREAHLALAKIAHASGIGRDSLRLVDTTPDFALDPRALADAIVRDRAAGDEPFLVVATVGTTSAGTIDPLDAIADTCAELGVALHVDAAWGGAACLSDTLLPILGGIERAASVTIDAHKWLSVPMGAGMFICTDQLGLAAVFGLSANYMPPATRDTVDLYTNSVQWSRRHAGLKLFVALATLGQSGYAAMLERMTSLGDELRDKLGAARFVIVNATPLPVVCVADPALDAAERASSGAYARAAERLQDRGVVWVSATTVAGRPVLRACVTNYETTSLDLDALVDELDRARASA